MNRRENRECVNGALHLPRSSYDFLVCDFLYDFRHRRRSWATTYVLTIHTGIVRFFDLPFVDVLIQKRKAMERQSYVSADSTWISPIRFDTKHKEAAR